MLVGVLPLLALRFRRWRTHRHPHPRAGARARRPGLLRADHSVHHPFGARHIATREKHEGLVFAIAFESVVKLVAISIIGLYALYGVFDGPQDLQSWLVQNQSSLSNLHTPLQEGPGARCCWCSSPRPSSCRTCIT